jgi:hypothetical protein
MAFCSLTHRCFSLPFLRNSPSNCLLPSTLRVLSRHTARQCRGFRASRLACALLDDGEDNDIDDADSDDADSDDADNDDDDDDVDDDDGEDGDDGDDDDA